MGGRRPPAGKDDAERCRSPERCRIACHPYRFGKHRRKRSITYATGTFPCNNDLSQLGKWEVQDFSRFKGFGPAKSITIMAALELGKRRKLQERPERTTIRSSKDIYEIFHPLLCDLAHEEFWVLLLNQASRVITNPASAEVVSTRLLLMYAASCVKL